MEKLSKSAVNPLTITRVIAQMSVNFNHTKSDAMVHDS